ncbi:hypothetical protein Pcinc_007857 [Petrolisthes cinctipes]|uniref:Uncharacterized protein n=1 Tax=Petrolisthes cinctipes TaxID=88211 RepID=A0AAE1KY55_PETCI|nr:hypothetical protein Pcinc_007857 [Petrolisthes cinctipes]
MESVDHLIATHHYAKIRYPCGREATFSTKGLAPYHKDQPKDLASFSKDQNPSCNPPLPFAPQTSDSSHDSQTTRYDSSLSGNTLKPDAPTPKPNEV